MISAEEELVFAEFCKLAGRDFLAYEAVDPPDYVRKDKMLAIDLSEYHSDQSARGSNARNAEESAKSLVNEAKQRYFSECDERVDVYVFMQGGWKGLRTKAAHALSKLVQHNRSSDIVIAGDYLPGELLGPISEIWIAPTPAYQPKPLWQPVMACIPEVLVKSVQQTLDDKEEKIDTYRDHAEVVELLIYSWTWPCVGQPDQVNPSRCGAVTNELIDTEFLSSFDNVYYLDRQRECVIQLKLTRP